MKILSVVLLAALALPACARLHRAEIASQAQNEMVGMSKKDLYICAGVPARQETVEGLEFLTYVGGGDSAGVGVGTATSPTVGVGVVSSQHRYCEVTFVLNKSVVQKVNYQGRTGGLISKGEQCAFVVENCIKQ